MNEELKRMITNAVYGEGADASSEVKAMIASTIINRMEANRPKEFGKDVPEILNKGYYAVSNPNEPYKQAISGNIQDELSKRAYKETEDVVESVLGGNKQKGMFYFTPDEEVKLRPNPKKFNFNMVKPVGKVGKYNVYSY